MPFDVNMLIIAAVIVLVAYLLFALSGFGSTLSAEDFAFESDSP